jgi:dTDP-4-amino-4,6-dideoxygalactose transaminase
MYGIPADLDAITALAGERGIPVVEDACQGAGATLHGRPVGSAGTFGCFSFHANKLVGAPFDGGMVCTDAASLARRVRALCEPSWEDALTAPQPRVPARLAPLAVPVLRHKLQELEAMVRLRTQQVEHYGAALAGDAQSRILAPPPGGRASYRSCVLVSPRIGAFRAALRRHGWDLSPMYAQTVAFIRAAERAGAQLPNARWLAEHHLILPTGESVKHEDLESIGTALATAARTC